MRLAGWVICDFDIERGQGSDDELLMWLKVVVQQESCCLAWI